MTALPLGKRVAASPALPTPAQFAAAKQIYQHAIQWQRTDAALHLLRELVPGFVPEATLLKAATVNALYSTNVYAIVRVADHVTDVLDGRDLSAPGPELVEDMANVPAGGGEKRPRRRPSFASKFAHFFIAPDRFPILDRYADETVRRHLGSQRARKPKRPYVTFAANFERLRATIDPRPSIEELDRYLLIAGQARAFRDGRRRRSAPSCGSCSQPIRSSWTSWRR